MSAPGSFFPGAGDERTAVLAGSSAALRSSLSAMIDAVEDPRSPMLHLVVPEAAVASLLMHSGNMLRTVGTATGTTITILPPSPIDERVIKITRSPNATSSTDSSSGSIASAAVSLMTNLSHAGVSSSMVVDYARAAPQPAVPTGPAPGEQPVKSRIEALRDQLLKLAKAEQSGRQQTVQPSPEPQQLPSQQQLRTQVTPMMTTMPMQQPSMSPAHPQAYHSHLPPMGVPSPPIEVWGRPAAEQPFTLDSLLQTAANIAASNADILGMQCVIKMPRVPNKFCSAVIGQKGLNVRDIQDSTGTKVQVVGEQTTSLKEITVTGEVHKVHAALMAICDIMISVEMGFEVGRDRDTGPAVSQWLKQGNKRLRR